MSELLSGAQSKFLGIAVMMLIIAVASIRVITVSIRQRLGPGSRAAGKSFAPQHVESVPQDLLKEALARGLLTPSQLANMSDEERQFVFVSLRKTLRDEGLN